MRFRTPPLALLAALLVWAGCDAAAPEPAFQDDPAFAALAAAAVASSVGVAPGGALFDLAEAAATLDALRQPGRFAAGGCEAERVWDEAAGVWRQEVACERGHAGVYYLQFARSQSFAFTDGAGAPVQRPAEAASVAIELHAEGVRRTPHASHTLAESAARLTLAGLDGEVLVADGTSSRTATDSLRTRDGLRTFAYTTTLAFDDVTGPRWPRLGGGAWWTPPSEWGLGGAHAGWAGAVSGTISGRITGVTTWETPEGTRSRAVDQAFTVAFEGGGTATVRIGAATFTVDLLTGDVR